MIQGASRVSKRSSKDVSRDFQGSFKTFEKVSRVFTESIMCVSRKTMLQGCFKNVSRKFCFAILLLHESHCNYLPWGTNIFHTHMRRGGTNIFVGGSGGFGDVDEEIVVSEANISVSKASKLSAGARILVARRALKF